MSPSCSLPSDDQVRAAGKEFASRNAELGDERFSEELRHLRRLLMFSARRQAPVDDYDNEFVRQAGHAFNRLSRFAYRERAALRRAAYQPLIDLLTGDPVPDVTRPHEEP